MTELVVALDEPTFDRARDVVRLTSPHVAWYKVGYEAYYGYGDRILRELRDADKSIFLDLKLHDIPNTVAAGVRGAARLGVRMLTIHAAGGARMMSAAVAARDEALPEMRLMAVTVLTSMDADELRETGVDRAPDEIVVTRARLAAKVGVDGVVCAVAEAPAVRAATSPAFSILCQGIRPKGADANDQRRVATPVQAVAAGANYIGVGRPITQAKDPAAAVRAILDEMKQPR